MEGMIYGPKWWTFHQQLDRHIWFSSLFIKKYNKCTVRTNGLHCHARVQIQWCECSVLHICVCIEGGGVKTGSSFRYCLFTVIQLKIIKPYLLNIGLGWFEYHCRWDYESSQSTFESAMHLHQSLKLFMNCIASWINYTWLLRHNQSLILYSYSGQTVTGILLNMSVFW